MSPSERNRHIVDNLIDDFLLNLTVPGPRKESDAKPAFSLTMTARGILGILWQVYPGYRREEDLENDIGSLPDADKELEYLREKELVNRISVPSKAKAKRIMETMFSGEDGPGSASTA